MQFPFLMNILYIGAFPPAFLVERTLGKIDSLYRASEALINGFRSIDEVHLKVITSPDVFRYPHGPLFIKHEENKKEDVTVVSMLNLPIIKQWWSIRTLLGEAKKYLRAIEGPVVVIIPYVVLRHATVLTKLYRLFPDKVVRACIVPDIFFPKSRRGRRSNDKAERLVSKFDCFVLYTAKMAEKLNVSPEKCIVIEGFREVSLRKPTPSDRFRVVYAGSLNRMYGISRLLEATTLITDPEVEFHFYGGGNAEEDIRKASQEDNRIKYHGRVPNAEAVDAIYAASVLVNPRNSYDGKYTEYSFPSKDIEYMATGIPTLLCKLPGMPQEYYNHFIDIGEGSSEQIAEAIISVKNMSQEERDVIGQDSRNFIIERMNIQRQAETMVNLFQKIINDNTQK